MVISYMEESFPDDICRPPLMHHSSRIASSPAPHHPEVGKGIGNGAQLAEEVRITQCEFKSLGQEFGNSMAVRVY
jgi:hypothetical protein